MSRYIDADELLREVEKAENSMEYHGQEFSYSFLSRGQEVSTEWYYVEDLIDNQPTADVAPVRHGRWIHDGYDFFPQGIDWIHCSVCGKRWINVPADLPKYCPCCGARMEGAEDAGREH